MTTLFDELQIGSMELKNRTFMAPMSLGYGDQTGIPTLQVFWNIRNLRTRFMRMGQKSFRKLRIQDQKVSPHSLGLHQFLVVAI